MSCYCNFTPLIAIFGLRIVIFGLRIAIFSLRFWPTYCNIWPTYCNIWPMYYNNWPTRIVIFSLRIWLTYCKFGLRIWLTYYNTYYTCRIPVGPYERPSARLDCGGDCPADADCQGPQHRQTVRHRPDQLLGEACCKTCGLTFQNCSHFVQVTYKNLNYCSTYMINF